MGDPGSREVAPGGREPSVEGTEGERWRRSAAVRILPFAPDFQVEVVALIVSIQRDEFGIDIGAEQQPDLGSIPSFYQTDSGNFWVAVVEGRVVGTISLLDLGGGLAALRKMFVHRSFRGRAHAVAPALLATLLAWAEGHGITDIHLGTTPVFHAAHRFYEKHGFREIPKGDLPAAFPIMEVDTKFYHLRVADSQARRAEACSSQ